MSKQKIIISIPAQTFDVEVDIPDGPVVIDPPDPGTVTPSGLIGTNCFPWSPLEKLKGFNLRCYIDTAWIWREKGLYINPMFRGKAQTAFGMMDEYFNMAAAFGIDVLPCVNMIPLWYNGKGDSTGSASNHFPPIKNGRSRIDPGSYADYAEFWAQFVMRYGTRTFSDNLRVDTTPRWTGDIPNVPRSGLGALDLDKGGTRIKYVEINNEVDIWWKRGGNEDAAYMKAEEHVAQLIAVYRAIRKVSDIKVVMAGLTGLDLTYLKAMFSYAEKTYPGEKFTDVINVHYYTNIGNEYAKHPPTWVVGGACYPEKDKGFSYLKEIVKFGKEKGLPVWLSEFGADTKPESWMHIKGDGISDEQAQAELITRTFKMCAEYGVERAYVFTANDEGGGTGLWQRCGLMTSEATGYQPKPSYNAVLKLIEETGKRKGQKRFISKPEQSDNYSFKVH